jgi:hypothetical protein
VFLEQLRQRAETKVYFIDSFDVVCFFLYSLLQLKSAHAQFTVIQKEAAEKVTFAVV